MDKMERKAFHALLLSLAVIAGAVTITTDAYAQTNTERLIMVVDNTNEANSLLSDLLDAVTNGFTQVLAMLGGIDGEVESIHGEVESIHGEVESIHGEVEALSSAVSGIEGDIRGLSSSLAGVGAAASALTAVNAGISANADAIAALDAKLDMISTAVGAVQETVATPADGTTAALRELHSATIAYGVPVSAFGANDANDDAYKVDLKLTCEYPVFLDSITTDIGAEPSPTYGVFVTNAAMGDTEASVTANGMTVYNTQFRTGETATSVYTAGASFNLAELAADKTMTIALSTDRTDTLIDKADGKTFSIMTYLNTAARDRLVTNSAGGVVTDPDGAHNTNLTKADAGKVEVFTLTIDLYSSAEDAECTVTPPTGPSVDYTETDETVSFTINAAAGETRSIKTIEDETFSCSGATAITKVSMEGGLIADFATFISLNISADSTVPLKFERVTGTDVLEATFEDPFELSSGDVTIAGKIPGSAALVSVTYDTVKDATCSTN